MQNTFLHKVGKSFLDVQCVADCNQLVDAGSGVSFFPFTDFLVTDIDAIVAEKLGESYARLADLLVTKCRDAAALAAQPFDAVVDALYGTGFHGSLRPAGLAACALMNRQRESGAFVLAVDLPSGINTDTGEAAKGAVRADLTVTFDSCKPLHTAPSSAPFCGEIVCADIGIRDEWHPAGLAQL